MNRRKIIIINIKLVILILLFNIFNTISISAYNNSNLYVYYNYNNMMDLFMDLRTNYSTIFSLESIGNTYQGRDIWLVKLSDNVQYNEKESGILLMGAHHGNEKISFEILIYFIKFMVENYGKENFDNDNDGLINEDPIDGKDNDFDGLFDEDPSEQDVTDIIDNNQIFIIPMVNPDGVEANTRKNCVPNHGSFGLKKEITSTGVNLNRNYGFKWFLYYFFPFRYSLFFNVNDNSPNYRGPYQFSENETKAVKKFVESQNIKISISYHSFSEVILYPWTHTSARTPDEKIFVSIGENISKINGYFLYTGNIKLPIPGGTIGTSENWLYGEEKIISYTIELCKSYAPTNPEIVLDTCIRHVGVNMYVCEIASNIKISNKKYL